MLQCNQFHMGGTALTGGGWPPLRTVTGLSKDWIEPVEVSCDVTLPDNSRQSILVQ